MSASRDDEPVKPRGAVRPPPSLAPDDAPASVDVPRMDPPPASLEAMVRSARDPGESEDGPAWLLWVVLLAMAVAALTGYVLK